MAEMKKKKTDHYPSTTNRFSAPRKIEYIRNGNGNSNRATAVKNGKGNFNLESLMVLICLTVSLLVLPLILPPLPPPPFLLLLIPIGILGVLMVLAFMPSEVRDLTHTCM